MKKTWLGLAYASCLTLFVASAWLLLTPIKAFAATCTAECKYQSVTCSGSWCNATDYWGCKYTDADGEEKTKRCDATELEIQ